jgi:hypothetical protein
LFARDFIIIGKARGSSILSYPDYLVGLVQNTLCYLFPKRGSLPS